VLSEDNFSSVTKQPSLNYQLMNSLIPIDWHLIDSLVTSVTASAKTVSMPNKANVSSSHSPSLLQKTVTGQQQLTISI